MKFILSLFLVLSSTILNAQKSAPIRLAVAGTSHGHVGWVFNNKDTGNVVFVGFYEPDTALVNKHRKEHGLPASLFYTDLAKMLDELKPQGVVAFGSIFSHLSVVEACAPRGIHVMVEKPLAVSNEHAMKINALAEKYKIHVLTNYETSWYYTTEKSYQLVKDSNYVGRINKAVFHHGHEGPKEINVSKEFFDWLTDPVLNGGGALVDFGCYGANIMTYLMQKEQPLSVTAVTRRYKPEIYPKVDDDATIIVEYPSAEAIIQASWNWPFGRKDMEIYGKKGYIITKDSKELRMKNNSAERERIDILGPADIAVYQDPFSYFADVLRNKIKVADGSLYSLSNNVTVVKILSAARESAKTGRKVMMKH
jgi:predicted dehydrogenase